LRVTEGLPSQKGEKALHCSCADDIMGASYSLLVDQSRLLPLPELRRGGGTRRRQQAVGIEHRVGTPQGTTAAWRWISAGRIAHQPRERQPPVRERGVPGRPRARMRGPLYAMSRQTVLQPPRAAPHAREEQRCPTRGVHPSHGRGRRYPTAHGPPRPGARHRPRRRPRMPQGASRHPPLAHPTASSGDRGAAGGLRRRAHGQRGVSRGRRPRRALAAAGWRQGGCRAVPRGDPRRSARGTTPPQRPPALTHLHLRPFSVLVNRTLGAFSRPCAATRRCAHAARRIFSRRDHSCPCHGGHSTRRATSCSGPPSRRGAVPVHTRDTIAPAQRAGGGRFD